MNFSNLLKFGILANTTLKFGRRDLKANKQHPKHQRFLKSGSKLCHVYLRGSQKKQKHSRTSWHSRLAHMKHNNVDKFMAVLHNISVLRLHACRKLALAHDWREIEVKISISKVDIKVECSWSLCTVLHHVKISWNKYCVADLASIIIWNKLCGSVKDPYLVANA